jgi:hypothetical protein
MQNLEAKCGCPTCKGREAANQDLARQVAAQNASFNAAERLLLNTHQLAAPSPELPENFKKLLESVFGVDLS